MPAGRHERPALTAVPRARLGISLAASVLLHALALGLMLHRRLPLRPGLVTIPVALVGLPGGGPGTTGEPAAAPATPPEAPPPPAAVARRPAAPPPPRRVARAAAPRSAEPSPASPGSGGEGAASAGGAPGRDGGGGDGGGGDGSGGARVAYGTNPLPPYPLVARRLGKEGVVVLEVLVAPDGHAADVRVLRSSGFAPLDESAMTTVRDRWRFIPARRGGEAVETRVTVPIRFRLEDVAG